MNEAVDLAIISNRRTRGAAGADGGGHGQPGENDVLHADGSAQRLAGRARCALPAGSRLRIATPGGGGWGPPSHD